MSKRERNIMSKKDVNRFTRRIVTLVLIAVALLIMLVTFFTSINIIQDGTIGVVRQFGEITETITPGGWNMRLSWIHDVEIFDVRTREADMEFSAYSIDAQNISGRMSIQYRLSPGSAQYVAREFGTLEELESMIHAMFNQMILNTISARTATYLVEQMYKIESELSTRIYDEQERFHITVTNIALEGLQFSDAFRAAVDQRIVAREYQEQTRIEIETERLRAQLRLDVARLEGEAVVVAAEADAQAILAMLEVWGDLGPEVRELGLRQLAIETWDGILPQVISGGDFSLILDNFTE